MSTVPRCDSHVHVVGPIERYPQLPTRTYLAGPAPLNDLRAGAAARGISRFVIVQPSFYGTDNTLLLESLDSLGDQGRGVAVIDPTKMPRETLTDCASRGVCGLRINLYSILGSQERRLDRAFAALVEIARTMNWHIEVIAPIARVAEHFELLLRSHVPVVIDHYGVYGRSTPETSDGRRFLELLAHRHVWIKLSAPYRVSENPLETHPDKAWLGAILAVAADRCVWGSDWPHTPSHEAQEGADVLGAYRPLAYERVVDDFLAALPSSEVAGRIMSDNPGRLYGFAG
jgi:predicted TIM-barrel fold metal-dependent hydrolase